MKPTTNTRKWLSTLVPTDRTLFTTFPSKINSLPYPKNTQIAKHTPNRSYLNLPDLPAPSSTTIIPVNDFCQFSGSSCLEFSLKLLLSSRWQCRQETHTSSGIDQRSLLLSILMHRVRDRDKDWLRRRGRRRPVVDANDLRDISSISSNNCFFFGGRNGNSNNRQKEKR